MATNPVAGHPAHDENLPGEVDVLVVGAGPVGLTVAVVLRMWGVDVVVLDAAEGPTSQSRAVWVHPRTTELLHGMGVAEAMREEAVLLDRIDVHRGNHVHGSIHYDGRGRTRFPEGMIIEQSRTQRLLMRRCEQLGVRPRWNSEVSEVRQSEAYADVRLAGPAGQTIRARWVVGADGARSLVRQEVGLDLVGGTYATSFFTGDLVLRTGLDRQRAHMSVTPRRTFALLPLPGVDRWRVVATVPPAVEATLGSQSGPTGGPDLSADQVEGLMAGLRVPHTILGQEWATLYRSHHRVVDTFRAGRVLLAGDAAHIHSPAGGLGMNTGIGDAVNLAWRLAQVAGARTAEPAHSGRASADRLLDDYAEERRSVALDVLRTSDRAFTLQAGSGRLLGLLRTALFPVVPRIVNATQRGRRFAFNTLSQIGITYRHLPSAERSGVGESAISRLRRRRRTGLQVGDRLPYATTAAGRHSHEALRPDSFLLLGVGARLDQLRPVLDEAGLAYRHDVLPAEVCGQLALREPAAVLVRPDGHVWWRGGAGDPRGLRASLADAGVLGAGVSAAQAVMR